MEPVINLPGTVKGVEVLHFPDAEVVKTKNNQPSFASAGGLSVLYFKDYNRFILQLNDWRYPLLRRMNINSTGSGQFDLPAPNGFSYSLRINNPGSSLQSLSSLLEGTRKLETSPEDKLVRQSKPQSKDTGIKEVITQTIKQGVQKVQNKAATLTTGTKNLTSTKKRINLKDIKNKNFRKEAHSKLNKNFFQSNEKLSSEFLQRRRELDSSTQVRDFDSLRKMVDGPTMYVPKEEVEEAILLGKDAFVNSSPMEPLKSQPGTTGLRGESRTTPQVQSQQMPVTTEHYQG